MTESASLLNSVAAIEAGAHVTSATFLDDVPVFALGDGSLLFAGEQEARIATHPDAAILCAAASGKALVTGGDDGRVVMTDSRGKSTVLGEEKGQWVNAVAVRDDGATAWAAGRAVRARSGRGDTKSITMGSTVRGLAYAPKGYRLGMSHYDGASMWFPNTAEPPEVLAWKGSHLDVTWAPDGRFLVTTMQENALHGWRLADGGNMRMSGYPAKPRSLSWSRDGHWLATSGAEACVVWPFESKTGPMGKQPRECGVRPVRVTAVAFHPKALVVALGYDDGFVLLCRLTDASELPVRLEDAASGGVSALAWDGKGERIIFGLIGRPTCVY